MKSPLWAVGVVLQLTKRLASWEMQSERTLCRQLMGMGEVDRWTWGEALRAAATVAKPAVNVAAIAYSGLLVSYGPNWSGLSFSREVNSAF